LHYSCSCNPASKIPHLIEVLERGFWPDEVGGAILDFSHYIFGASSSYRVYMFDASGLHILLGKWASPWVSPTLGSFMEFLNVFYPI